MIPIYGSTGGIVPPDGAEQSRAPTAATPKAPPNPKLVEAAREFEGVFLRVVMSSLEKAANVGGPSSLSAGQSQYGSMIVDAMSDSISKSGGIGLADELVRDLEPRIERATGVTEGADPNGTAKAVKALK